MILAGTTVKVKRSGVIGVKLIGTGVIPPDDPMPDSEQDMHHIFANTKAMGGYSSGNFVDGSVIVFELRKTELQNGVTFGGERRRVDVMIKDSRTPKGTGGWGFERFSTANSVSGGKSLHHNCSLSRRRDRGKWLRHRR
jgi:Cytochrome P460